MKKIYVLIAFVFATLLTRASFVDAQSIDTNHFYVDANLTGSALNKKQIDFSVNVTPNNTAISFWKVRFFCNGKFSVMTLQSAGDICGKAISLTSEQIKNFNFSTSKKNRSTKLEEFSFKIKAYDANKKWLHTEEKAFRMK